MTPRREQSTTCLQPAACRAAVLLAFNVLVGCSNLASPQDGAPDPSVIPAYRTTIANFVRSTFKSIEATEISDLSWVHATVGWSSLACVRFLENGHRRTYALFMRDNAIVNSRYAVKTDECDTKTYSPFDLATGAATGATPPTATGGPGPLY